MNSVLPSQEDRLSGVSVVLMIVVLVGGGCDPSVQVIEPSPDYHFSLFGVLQVEADTQVVRVEPIGDSTQIGAPEDIEASVYLENLDTGTRVALNDSLTSVGGGIAKVHNFWTTHPIQAGTSYEVSVWRDGEAVTRATAATPAEPPTLRHNPEGSSDQPFLLPCEYDAQGFPSQSRNTFSFRIDDVETVAAVQVRYPLQGENRTLTVFNYYSEAVYDNEAELYRVEVAYGRDIASIPSGTATCPTRSQFTQPHAVVKAASGGPDWPDWQGVSLNTIARPDTFTNVQGGHGFLGGIYSDTLQVPVQTR